MRTCPLCGLRHKRLNGMNLCTMCEYTYSLPTSREMLQAKAEKGVPVMLLDCDLEPGSLKLVLLDGQGGVLLQGADSVWLAFDANDVLAGRARNSRGELLTLPEEAAAGGGGET